MPDESELQKELDFYRRRVDELAGQSVRADSIVSRAKRELKQRRQGFAVLTELHSIISTDMSPQEIFAAALDRVDRQLKMDRSLILQRDIGTQTFRPCFVQGFPADAAVQIMDVTIELSEDITRQAAPLLVTNATAPTATIDTLKRHLETPFFVCTAIPVGDSRDYLLISGRLREAKPFFPPLDEGDVYTIQSIAGFLGAALHNSALFAHTERMARSFARFVPSEFLQFLARESIVDVQLGDQTQQIMTVLFSDIRSFTSMSERMTPGETFAFINRYLERAAPVVRDHGGFIDKFIGDGIMALFPGDPARAIRAARGLHESVRSLNEEFVSEGRKPIAIGVGLNTGLLMLGAIGFADRMETTVVSDAVNQAARIEGMTKIYGASVVASGETIGALTPEDMQSMAIRRLDLVKVVGKAEPLEAFELFGADDGPTRNLKSETLARYNEAFAYWLSGDFQAAQSGFAAVVSRNPADRSAQIHLDRCVRFLERGAPNDWNGIVTLESK